MKSTEIIKLAILDVDGVLTDGKKYYNIDGMPFAKTFCDKDFTAIKRLKASGIKVCFLSGDERINKNIAKNRNIEFYYARGKDKVEFIPLFEEKYSIRKENMLYVGDDLFDINIMKNVGYSFCPIDAAKEIKDICGNNVLKNKGGSNIIMELVEVLLNKKLINDCTLQQIEELDKNEKF